MPPMPRWSEATLSTAPTVHLRQPSPERTMPPRAVSSTAASTVGSRSTRWLAHGPVMSPLTDSTPSMYTPSLVVIPTVQPESLRMCPTMRVVVVLPLVPVMAAIGMR